MFRERAGCVEATQRKEAQSQVIRIGYAHMECRQFIRQLADAGRPVTLMAEERVMNVGPFQALTRAIDPEEDLTEKTRVV